MNEINDFTGTFELNKQILVSCSDKERNCMQAHETSCKAHGTSCKLRELHAMQAYVTPYSMQAYVTQLAEEHYLREGFKKKWEISH